MYEVIIGVCLDLGGTYFVSVVGEGASFAVKDVIWVDRVHRRLVATNLQRSCDSVWTWVLVKVGYRKAFGVLQFPIFIEI